MDNILNKLKELERQVEENEYTEGTVSFYFFAEQLLINGDMIESLRNYFLGMEVIKENENIDLQEISFPEDDMKSICKEWHFDCKLIEELSILASECDGYYRIFEDYYYVAKGNVGDIFRIIELDRKVFVLEFYVID
ncbi:hypothetical protein [Pseudobutyrivibrio sp. MD2005]|uniref:hypothetical protein n=1 Tax=Pseudobutyrivibrio sp. MD2005 TaxID=1410616 RepID=UPI0004841EE1|nr:hypothetical protein [Pseudobutyrivibrio sp. MD2005]